MDRAPLTLLNHVKGGVGNQLFQHAFARSLARRLQADLVTDLSSFAADPYGRQCRLTDLAPDLRTGTLGEFAGAGAYLLQDGQLAALDAPLQLPPDARTLVLSGYWQSDALLDPDVVQDLHRQLEIHARERVPAALRERIATAAHPVAVHVRRRDYAHMGLCRERYFCAAIAVVRQQHPDAELFVFTDEPNQVRHWMALQGLAATQVATGDDLADLSLMAACRHFVIANSSFSWWAARWGEQRGGLVFCPAEWVTITPVASPCPPRWIHVPDAVQPFVLDAADIAAQTARLQALVAQRAAPPSGAAAVGPVADASTGRIDLRRFLDGMPEHVVIRLAEHFPDYRDHEDIDILCRDVAAVQAHILRVGQAAVAAGFRIEEHRDQGHLHLDVYPPGATRLGLRFDLIGDLTGYRQFVVDPQYHMVVLDSRRQLVQRGCPVFVPAQPHEMVLRCLEYLEWKDRNPAKKKHLDYLARHADVAFLPLVQRYTNLVLPAGMAPPAASEAPAAATRMDYLLLWGHGLAHTAEILQMVRRHPDLEILSIVHREVADIAQFVQDVYACDTVPFVHLVAKTRYLLQTPPKVLFVLLRNHRPDEKQFGEGAFRHVQSQTIKDLKEAIRNRFNPRLADGSRSEEHVVHASDYPSQVAHVLQVLGLPPLAHFEAEAHADIDAPYHLGALGPVTLAELPLDALVARLLDQGLVPVRETPHYQYALGHPEPYRAYHAKHFGTTLTDDHLPEAFDALLQDFRYGERQARGKRSLIVVRPLGDGRYRILDGLHRAAILAARGATTAEVAVSPAG